MRIIEAAKEFNIGIETLVEFLIDRGFVVKHKVSTKLTSEMYNALQIEFLRDKLSKRISQEIALPKGSLIKNIKKAKEELDIDTKTKEEKRYTPGFERELLKKREKTLQKKKTKVRNSKKKSNTVNNSSSPLNPNGYKYGYVKIITTSMGNKK